MKAASARGASVALLPGSDTLASFSSRGPRKESVPAGPKPDIAGPGASITSVRTGVTYASATGFQFTGGSSGR
ncbi:MAG: hypothetical protein IPL90_12715 [Holophagales bacterium]|nr:hypothetical protein [Holophagales bacterium]